MAQTKRFKTSKIKPIIKSNYSYQLVPNREYKKGRGSQSQNLNKKRGGSFIAQRAYEIFDRWKKRSSLKRE